AMRRRAIASSGLRWPVAGVEAMRIFIVILSLIVESTAAATSSRERGPSGQPKQRKASKIVVTPRLPIGPEWLPLNRPDATARRPSPSMPAASRSPITAVSERPADACRSARDPLNNDVDRRDRPPVRRAEEPRSTLWFCTAPAHGQHRYPGQYKGGVIPTLST